MIACHTGHLLDLAIIMLTCLFCRSSKENLASELKQISQSVHKLQKQIKGAPDDVKNQMKTFVQVSYVAVSEF